MSLDVVTIPQNTPSGINLNNDENKKTQTVDLGNGSRLTFNKDGSSWDFYKNDKQVIGAWGDPHITLGGNHVFDHYADALFLTESGLSIFSKTVKQNPEDKATWTNELLIKLPSGDFLNVKNLAQIKATDEMSVNYYNSRSEEAKDFEKIIKSAITDTDKTNNDFYINDSLEKPILTNISPYAIKTFLGISDKTEKNYGSAQSNFVFNMQNQGLDEKSARQIFNILSMFI